MNWWLLFTHRYEHVSEWSLPSIGWAVLIVTYPGKLTLLNISLHRLQPPHTLSGISGCRRKDRWIIVAAILTCKGLPVCLPCSPPEISMQHVLITLNTDQTAKVDQTAIRFVSHLVFSDLMIALHLKRGNHIYSFHLFLAGSNTINYRDYLSNSWSDILIKATINQVEVIQRKLGDQLQATTNVCTK